MGFCPAANGAIIAVGSAINTASSGAGQVDVGPTAKAPGSPSLRASLVGDSYYGQAVGLVGSTLFVGDTSALGASSISTVTSSLFIETAVYADAGVYDDAMVENDAALEGGGSAPTLDGSAPSAGDASTGGNGAAGGGTASSSSGCSCALAGEDARGGLLALLGESALVVVAWVRRRGAFRRAGGSDRRSTLRRE